MPLPESIRSLLAVARRRLTFAALWVRLLTTVAVVAVAAAALFAVGRMVILPWAEAAALATLAAALVVVALVTLMRRPSLGRAALEADRRLGGYDRVSTALELVDRPDLSEPERRQVTAAAAWAERRDPTALGPVITGGALPWLAALGVAAALALALIPSPADAALQERNRQTEAIEREAQRLEVEAADLPEEVRRQLEDTARRLRESADIDEALARLGEARERLAAQSDPAELARRTALAGMERRLQQEPLGEGESAADQLRDLASRTGEMTPAELESSADELAQRAEDFQGIDGDLAEALEGAADDLRRGGAGAEQSLSDAADELERATSEAAEAEAESQARSAVRDAQERLDNQRSGDAEGEGQGEGEGESQGEGQGQGQGQDQGQGQGQGQDQGQGEGENQGQGQGQGQGAGGGGGGQGAGGSQVPGTPDPASGDGTVQGGTGDQDPAQEPDRVSVFDPVGFEEGEEVRVRLEGLEPGELRGRVEGEGLSNVPLAPYTERFAEYQSAALEALDRLTVPPALRDLVRTYFTELEPGQ